MSVARATKVCAPLLAVIVVSIALPLALATCVPSSVITKVRMGCDAAAVATTCTLLVVSVAPLLGELMLTVTVVLVGCVAVFPAEPLLPAHPLSIASNDKIAATAIIVISSEADLRAELLAPSASKELRLTILDGGLCAQRTE